MSEKKELSFYILVNGQKNGPFNKEEVTEKVHAKEILFIDQVSVDCGKSWQNLYDIEGFDRRSFDRSDELPHLPKQEIFDEEAKHATRVLMNSDHSSLDATVALAHIGNVSGSGANSGNSTKKINLAKLQAQDKHNKVSSSKSDMDENETINLDAPKKFKDAKWIALLVFSLIGLKFLYTSDDTNKLSKQKRPKNTSIQARTAKSKKLKRNQFKAKLNSKKRIPAKITKKPSLKNSKTFRKATRLRKPKRLSNNPTKMRFGNGRTPAQAHPQRRKLSRETLNPEDEYKDEYKDDYKDEYENEGEEEDNEYKDKRRVASKKKSKKKNNSPDGEYDDEAEHDEAMMMEEGEENEEEW